MFTPKMIEHTGIYSVLWLAGAWTHSCCHYSQTQLLKTLFNSMSNLSTGKDIFIIEEVGQFPVCHPASYLVKPCRLIAKRCYIHYWTGFWNPNMYGLPWVKRQLQLKFIKAILAINEVTLVEGSVWWNVGSVSWLCVLLLNVLWSQSHQTCTNTKKKQSGSGGNIDRHRKKSKNYGPTSG